MISRFLGWWFTGKSESFQNFPVENLSLWTLIRSIGACSVLGFMYAIFELPEGPFISQMGVSLFLGVTIGTFLLFFLVAIRSQSMRRHK
jgi:hypothetical protein